MNASFKKITALPIKSGVVSLMLATLLPGGLCLAETKDAGEKTAKEDAKPLYDPQEYRSALRKFHDVSGVVSNSSGYAWNWLGEGAVEYAKGNLDEAMAAFGQALSAGDRTVNPHAHFNLANTIYQRAVLAGKAMGGEKKPDPEKMIEALGNIIVQLKDSLSHYVATLGTLPNHEKAETNKKIVEDLLKQLEQKKEEMEQQQQQQQQEKKEGEGEEGEDGEGESEKEGKEPKEGEGEGKGKGKGEGQGEQKPGQGDKSQEKEGEGAGDKPKDNDGKGDKRTEEQKQKEEQAAKDANKEREGKVEALGDKKGNEGKGNEGNKGESQKDGQVNEKTGFSPANARRQAQRMSDEVQVRPKIDRVPERPFKNW